jgi:hypothetical protein
MAALALGKGLLGDGDSRSACERRDDSERFDVHFGVVVESRGGTGGACQYVYAGLRSSAEPPIWDEEVPVRD